MNAEQQALYQRIEAFQIDDPESALTFTGRLARENGWSLDYARRVVREYKRFAFLAVVAGHMVTPSEQVDQVWHMHMIYTKSYWEDFCNEVLQKPLHHHPTKGGEDEKLKFVGYYHQTLASYQQWFGEAPPPDIWHDANTRFGEDLQSRWVNMAHHYILPKAAVRWAALVIGLLLGIMLLTGAQVTTTFNPFDLMGDEFLALFLLVAGTALVTGWTLRGNAKHVPDPQPVESVRLDPYETAYLTDGAVLAVNTAVAALVNQKVVEVVEGTRPKLRVIAPLHQSSHSQWHPVERAVYDAATAYVEMKDVRTNASGPLDQIDQRLRELKLLVPENRDWQSRWLPILMICGVLMFGGIKILIGIGRDRPVGFLVIACLALVFIAVVVFGKRLHRTSFGDRVLHHLQRTNGALLTASPKLLTEGSGGELPMAVALYGLSVLSMSDLAYLETALQPPPNASGGYGGCGGGCGGGGCGGGCGGCGGCGGD